MWPAGLTGYHIAGCLSSEKKAIMGGICMPLLQNHILYDSLGNGVGAGDFGIRCSWCNVDSS